ncbi:hypothetical protein FRB99_006536, partial [Tulasnella sp. 403]
SSEATVIEPETLEGLWTTTIDEEIFILGIEWNAPGRIIRPGSIHYAVICGFRPTELTSKKGIWRKGSESQTDVFYPSIDGYRLDAVVTCDSDGGVKCVYICADRSAFLRQYGQGYRPAYLTFEDI